MKIPTVDEPLLAELLQALEARGITDMPQRWFLPSAATDSMQVVDTNESVLQAWESLRAEAMVCQRCRLAATRKNVVFGVGNTAARLVFVGEGPGADEDRQGEPFVGKAGALLTAAITKGMGLRREDVYICNVVKCRPPENRTPLPDETSACTPFLYRQLELIRPEVIVALGGPAQTALSGVAGGITRLRGTWREWRGIRLMPTFHPAYILRNPAAKKEFWQDLQEVMKVLHLPLPTKSAEIG